ncbi:alpha-ketoglutarate-dependent dioxygenase AlkB family protein [Pseudohalioglobus lutimaris]|uniref:Alpha-ketoglutarate-dependent dioxygenase AlkB n=1 Tax=Pseudohalioglobus lutimaris TaxID=1737061 RepID=A0A2N5X112_9GAMM|nr:alpha-ketoglutarate-dependent dioxygenase AlkB [Pseudohalioglobus lutimaris]PLW68177.1 alpha-ketoglutarate-dependent dioxygenase AlkB [Pseudohalioglobus lutimaris]
MTQLSLYPDAGVEALSLPGADLTLLRRPDLGVSASELLAGLLADTPWRQETITLFGKTHLQPRLLAWYGEADAQYRYSGKTYQPLPFTKRLETLRKRMASLAGAPFNSVLLNYYRNQRDSMGLHADDEPELGREPVIASLSLGEERVLYFRPKHDRELGALDLTLPSGSVLLMRGATQDNWKHGVRKLTRSCGPRLNLTFRYVQARPGH